MKTMTNLPAAPALELTQPPSESTLDVKHLPTNAIEDLSPILVTLENKLKALLADDYNGLEQDAMRGLLLLNRRLARVSATEKNSIIRELFPNATVANRETYFQPTNTEKKSQKEINTDFLKMITTKLKKANSITHSLGNLFTLRTFLHAQLKSLTVSRAKLLSVDSLKLMDLFSPEKAHQVTERDIHQIESLFHGDMLRLNIFRNFVLLSMILANLKKLESTNTRVLEDVLHQILNKSIRYRFTDHTTRIYSYLFSDLSDDLLRRIKLSMTCNGENNRENRIYFHSELLPQLTFMLHIVASGVQQVLPQDHKRMQQASLAKDVKNIAICNDEHFAKGVSANPLPADISATPAKETRALKTLFDTVEKVQQFTAEQLQRLNKVYNESLPENLSDVIDPCSVEVFIQGPLRETAFSLKNSVVFDAYQSFLLLNRILSKLNRLKDAKDLGIESNYRQSRVALEKILRTPIVLQSEGSICSLNRLSREMHALDHHLTGGRSGAGFENLRNAQSHYYHLHSQLIVIDTTLANNLSLLERKKRDAIAAAALVQRNAPALLQQTEDTAEAKANASRSVRSALIAAH